jgi:hypothetical protein
VIYADGDDDKAGVVITCRLKFKMPQKILPRLWDMPQSLYLAAKSAMRRQNIYHILQDRLASISKVQAMTEACWHHAR